jgi:Domain of unknown function (DUF4129)
VGFISGALSVRDPVGGDAARQAARHDLSRAEYHRDDPSLLDRIASWVGRHFDGVFDHGVGGDALAVVVILIGAVAIFAIVRAGRPTRLARAAAPDPADPLRPVGARDHRRLAAEFDAAGRSAEALREWLRATVRTIEERGVLDEQAGRTGARTAHEAGPLLPAVAEDLRAAMNAFDEVWFGGREARVADSALARSVADRVSSARIERRAAAASGYTVPS